MRLERDSLFAAEESELQSTGPLRYCLVAVERSIDRSNTGGGELTYSTKDANLAVGDRVTVPLGRSEKPVAGIVTLVGNEDLLRGLSPSKVKLIRDKASGKLPPDLLELARWISAYYVCPIGMVLSMMMPAAVKHEAGVMRERLLTREIPKEFDAESLKPASRKVFEALKALAELEFPIDSDVLRAKLDLANKRQINLLVQAGLLKEIEVISVREFGIVAKKSHGYGATSDSEIVPTADQARTIEGIVKGLGTFGVHLLRGVTGSGKTEVYLRVLRQVTDAGQSAIVLVPEIALTPQTAARFEKRFTGAGLPGVAVLHSGLTASQRHAAWARVASGEARVVVGARSAIFAPVVKLGLIVVDEEHDGSYKQDQLPRYHGRDVAIKRAQLSNCPVILGSATPSLESWSNAKAGKSTLWTLSERAGAGALPKVAIVDMAKERAERAHFDPQSVKHVHLLGPKLEKALDATLAAGGQAILLLNRRGFANYISCPSPQCGWILSCDDCDARLVLHRSKDTPRGGFVTCHLCLARKLMPKVCPVCGKPVVAFGLGTQRVEDEVVRKLGPSRGLVLGETLLRCDSDTMRHARDYDDALGRFANGEVKVLVGTQMLAKGLDFPNVRLVGVVLADTTLALPDFRAAERTFQLISQVAGRAGRSAAAGMVIVQTLSPESPAINFAAKHDYEGFAARELAIRTSAKLPPVTRMARIVCRDLKAEKARIAAEEIAAALRAVQLPLRVIGAMEAPISRIAAHYRYAVEVFASSAPELLRGLTVLRDDGLLKSDAHTAVDVDPIDLL